MLRYLSILSGLSVFSYLCLICGCFIGQFDKDLHLLGVLERHPPVFGPPAWPPRARWDNPPAQGAGAGAGAGVGVGVGLGRVIEI